MKFSSYLWRIVCPYVTFKEEEETYCLYVTIKISLEWLFKCFIFQTVFEFFLSMSSLEILLFIPASSKTMWEPSLVVWTFFILTLLSITFLSKILKNGKYIGQDDQSQRRYKFPPGRRSWPVIGDSFHWYSAIASSHPSKYVEEQAKR